MFTREHGAHTRSAGPADRHAPGALHQDQSTGARSGARGSASSAPLTVERNFVTSVLDSIHALVLVLDTAGRIVRFNRACETVSGFSFAELVGRSFPEELFPAEERDHAVRMFEQARAGKLDGSYEMHWRTRDGGTRRIAWTASSLNDPQGDVNFVITTGIDVTEQRQGARPAAHQRGPLSPARRRLTGHHLHSRSGRQRAVPSTRTLPPSSATRRRRSWARRCSTTSPTITSRTTSNTSAR